MCEAGVFTKARTGDWCPSCKERDHVSMERHSGVVVDVVKGVTPERNKHKAHLGSKMFCWGGHSGHLSRKSSQGRDSFALLVQEV